MRFVNVEEVMRDFGISVGNTGVQLTVGRYGVLVDIGYGLGS
jgi:hypothetical protein